MLNKIKIYRVHEILTELENCINKKLPYSLLRFGDGGIKLLYAILNNNQSMIKSIIGKEGIPLNKIYPVFYLWGKYAREANFIDCPEVYFSKEFWPRFKRPDIIPIIKNWRQIYHDAEFDNNKYCNPEFNFLSLIKIGKNKTLIDVLTGKNVCCITNCTTTRPYLIQFCKPTFVEIVGWNDNHYKNSFKKTVKIIKKNAKKFDVWLVGAGELGRLYSGLIKHYGGRAVDIGSVFDCWIDHIIPKRLKNYVYKPNDSINFYLLSDAMKYEKFI